MMTSRTAHAVRSPEQGADAPRSPRSFSDSSRIPLASKSRVSAFSPSPDLPLSPSSHGRAAAITPRLLVALALALWSLSGFYIVAGNERAIVRQFGAAQRTATGTVELRPSGWHYALPWPFSRVDRVNFQEVRTATLGLEETAVDVDTFLQTVEADYAAQFLTGDKNILNLQVQVQYRLSETGVADYLFRGEQPEEQLRRLAEAATADLISRSGVDFVHPLGSRELNLRLTERTRRLAAEQRLGLEVEDVSLVTVQPPVRVKADFLDVANARADREQYVNAALGYQEQRRALAESEAQTIRNQARIERDQLVSLSQSRAVAFGQLLARLEAARREERPQLRRLAMERLWLEAMEELLQQVQLRVIDGQQAADLTIFHTAPGK